MVAQLKPGRPSWPRNLAGALALMLVVGVTVGRYAGFFGVAGIAKAETAVRHEASDVSQPLRVALLRHEYKKFALTTEEAALFGPATGGAVPVLVYHEIVADGEPLEFTDTSVSEFKRQMFAVKRAGYRAISLKEFRDFLDGKLQITDRAVLITFDDGIRSSFERTDDVLAALDFRAVNFVISGYSLDSEIPYYMHEKDIKRFLATGRWEIQSHGDNSHRRSAVDAAGAVAPELGNKLWLAAEGRLETDDEYRERVTDDLARAKERVAGLSDEEVFAFAVPFNDFGQLGSNYAGATEDLLDAVWKSYEMFFYQFRTAVQGEFRSNFPSEKEHRAIMRIPVGEDTNVASLLSHLAASERKVLPFADNFTNEDSWVDVWSTHDDYKPRVESNYKGEMKIGSNSESAGSFTYLDGSYDWSDYRFDTTVEWEEGKGFALVSRLRNAFEYLACEYAPGSVRLAQYGKENPEVPRILAERAIGSVGPSEARQQFAMTVRGDTATCVRDGETLVSADIPSDVLSYGGVALKSWSHEGGRSKLSIRALEVTPLSHPAETEAENAAEAAAEKKR